MDDHIIDELWKNELDFFSLLEKNRLLSERINIDEKTGLLKHNQNYLAEIVKTASRIMSSLIKERSRPTDYAIRFGGEEIDIIVPSTPSEGAEIYATKILQDTERLRFSYNGEDSITTTMSAGISSTSIQLTHISGINALENKYRNHRNRLTTPCTKRSSRGKTGTHLTGSMNTGKSASGTRNPNKQHTPLTDVKTDARG